jgi:hypothetical protein
LAEDSTLSKAKIAARQGFSRARATQVMNLQKSPAKIQAVLAEPPAPVNIHFFSEKNPRMILENNDGESQLGEWRHFPQKLQTA